MHMLYVCIYIYIHVYVYMYICIHIHTYNAAAPPAPSLAPSPFHDIPSPCLSCKWSARLALSPLPPPLWGGLVRPTRLVVLVVLLSRILGLPHPSMLCVAAEQLREGKGGSVFYRGMVAAVCEKCCYG